MDLVEMAALGWLWLHRTSALPLANSEPPEDTSGQPSSAFVVRTAELASGA
jgi:hypothetical protein